MKGEPMGISVMEAVMKVIESEGVEYIFGIPGSAILPFYNTACQSQIAKHLIDIEPTQIGKVFEPDLGIVSDAKLALQELLKTAQTMQKIQRKNKSVEQLRLEIEALTQELLDQENEKSDLEILLENIIEHSTNIEAELHEKNEEMSRYLQQVFCITAAAAAVEAGTFQSHTLDEVAARSDELGQLARVFQRMTEQVRVREEKLKQQVEELRIEIDQSKRMQQVSQITKTDSFQQLKQKIKQLRG
jgi:DNA repair exonuclease SbcCD ATPase subunit